MYIEVINWHIYVYKLHLQLTITGMIRVVITANGVSLHTALIKFLIQVYNVIKNSNANKYTTLELMVESQHCCNNKWQIKHATPDPNSQCL